MIDLSNIYNKTRYIDDLFSKKYDIKSEEIIKNY